jgi:hypothetical protein
MTSLSVPSFKPSCGTCGELVADGLLECDNCGTPVAGFASNNDKDLDTGSVFSDKSSHLSFGDPGEEEEIEGSTDPLHTSQPSSPPPYHVQPATTIRTEASLTLERPVNKKPAVFIGLFVQGLDPSWTALEYFEVLRKVNAAPSSPTDVQLRLDQKRVFQSATIAYPSAQAAEAVCPMFVLLGS